MKTSSSVVVSILFLGACGLSGACSPSSNGKTGGSGGDAATGDEGGSSGPAGGVEFFTGGGDTSGPFTVTAGFDRVSGTGTGNSPCEMAVGDCQYCGPVEGGAGVHVTFLSAGVITVDDGSKTIATLNFSATGESYEADSQTDSSLKWSPGDALGVSAAGETIPAFSGSIAAPKDIAGVAPALSFGAPTAISTGKDFVLSWTPSSDDGQMKLVLGNEKNTYKTVSCTVAEGAGSVSVASSLLQKLGAGGGTAGLTKTVSKSVAVSGAQVSIMASAPQVAGTVTFGP
jgi:hypothetical protein